MKPVKDTKPVYDYWKKAADRVVKELWKFKDSWIFFEPVDPIKLNIPDYHKIITNPMDLGTVKNNLKSGVYLKVEEFMRDVELIFENCILYNGENSPVSLMCKNVRNEYERLSKDYQLNFYTR